jgi:hypothetical protein
MNIELTEVERALLEAALHLWSARIGHERSNSSPPPAHLACGYFTQTQIDALKLRLAATPETL